MYICVDMYIYIYTCTHRYVYIYMCIYKYRYIQIYVYLLLIYICGYTGVQRLGPIGFNSIDGSPERDGFRSFAGVCF